jgi:eukaryotic-like serine/threonine-protein kinase
MTTYETVRPLGTGGMATVHLARGGEGHAHFAIKRLHPFLAEDPMAGEQLREEARIAGSVKHPNVVGIVDVIEEDGRPALVMEWVDGVDLAMLRRKHARSNARLPLERVITIARDLLEALAAVHERGIVHGDVSPQNVLLGHDGVARLTDFGLARRTADAPLEIATVSGTLGYMAPEQLEGRSDHRSDLFSAGVVIWELVTGRQLREATSGVQAFVEILRNDVQAPSALRAEAACLDDVLVRVLARAPEDRFVSAREMLDALLTAFASSRSFTSGGEKANEVSTVRPSRPSRPSRVSRPRARHAVVRSVLERTRGGDHPGSARSRGDGLGRDP